MEKMMVFIAEQEPKSEIKKKIVVKENKKKDLRCIQYVISVF